MAHEFWGRALQGMVTPVVQMTLRSSAQQQVLSLPLTVSAQAGTLAGALVRPSCMALVPTLPLHGAPSTVAQSLLSSEQCHNCLQALLTGAARDMLPLASAQCTSTWLSFVRPHVSPAQQTARQAACTAKPALLGKAQQLMLPLHAAQRPVHPWSASPGGFPAAGRCQQRAYCRLNACWPSIRNGHLQADVGVHKSVLHPGHDCRQRRQASTRARGVPPRWVCLVGMRKKPCNRMCLRFYHQWTTLLHDCMLAMAVLTQTLTSVMQMH